MLEKSTSTAIALSTVFCIEALQDASRQAKERGSVMSECFKV